MIPQDVIDAVLASYDIVEVVGRYVTLRAAGRSYKALCPFHDEKTASFTVNPDRQTFKCFGCGKGGHVIRFLMEHEGLTFPEAVKALAQERGIKLPETPGRGARDEGRYEAVLKALDLAVRFFRHSLASDAGREARAYLARRGYDEAACSRFGLGYAPAGWDRLLSAGAARGVDAATLEEAGLVVKRDEGGHYDRFRHRVVFPIADLRGRVVTFGARALAAEDQPKYLNGPETIVFKKANTLYALDRAKEPIRRTGEALLMEGYTDVLMCHLHGLDRAVAGMGTAFTSRQAGLLKRFARRVVLVYDGDEAGRVAAERTLDVLLPEGLEVRIALLPAGRDIDEVLLEEGTSAVDAILGAALDVLDFKLASLARRLDLGQPDGRARAGEALVQTLLKVTSPVERDQWLRAAAERLGGEGTEAALRAEAGRRIRSEGRRGTEVPSAATSGGAPAPVPPSVRVFERNRRETETFLLAGLVLFPSLRGRVLTAVGLEDFASPVNQRIYKAVLRMEGAAASWHVRTLSARLADDEEAQEVLAGLPDDPGLEDRIPAHLEFLERARRERRRAQTLLRDLGRAAGDADEAGRGADGGTDTSGTLSREQDG